MRRAIEECAFCDESIPNFTTVVGKNLTLTRAVVGLLFEANLKG